ncbi:MAG: zf-HC2 domain-containing protein [Vicinamibacterales bacterium]
MSEHWTDQLSAYLDDELAPADREACAAHLATCETCRETADELAGIAAGAAALGASGPARDLWPGIAARIVPAPARPAGRRISFSLPELALAATLLMAVSAGASWLAYTRGTPAPGRAEAPIQAVAESSSAPDAGVQLANFADAQYDAAVNDLERILQEERSRLDPRTVFVLERNLRAIDQAIAQARQALREDPSNTYLNSHLADARQRKLELLRRAAELTGGN